MKNREDLMIVDRAGFSLVELLVVMGLLTAGVVFSSQVLNHFQSEQFKINQSADTLSAITLPLEKLRAELKLARSVIVTNSATAPTTQIVLEFGTMDPTNTLNRAQVTYAYYPDAVTPANSKIIRSVQTLGTVNPAVTTLTLPKIYGVRWCVDNNPATSPGNSCPGTLTVDRFKNSKRRVVAEFDYLSPATNTINTLPFVAELENIPFDCRANTPLLMIKSN